MTATSRDVQEIIAKLSSDKAKGREEGVKLLSSWLEGERSISFCRLLGRNTAKMKPDELPHDETWPFVLTVLMNSISLEISASKKKPPKLLFAKTFRIAVQSAEDPKISGKELLLLSIAKLLFNHIWDVLKDIPSFQSEYSSVLRHILTIKEYCYQMRKRVYYNLALFYISKVGVAIDVKADGLSGSKEEVFRFIVTFHAILENPPGDYPDNIREDFVNGFIRIFSKVRDEGKISRKLMECVNAYLVRDGPNLGCQAMDIHSAIEDFMLHCWLTTHDRGLKNLFINYARILLKLCRSTAEANQLAEKLLDIIVKELDQSTNVSVGFIWNEVSRDDKVGTFGSIQQSLMDLAAMVFYQACKSNTITANQEKRSRLEHVSSRIRDGLMRGSWCWNGAFAFLIQKYGLRMDKSLLIYWFEGTIGSLKRILHNPDTSHLPDALLWLLRALQELSAVLLTYSSKESSQYLSFTPNEVSLVRNSWQDAWTCLMRGLPIFSTFPPVVEVGLQLLGDMILRDQVDEPVIPLDMWDLRIFKRKPSQSTLYFISSYFSRAGIQGDIRDVLYVRKDLLKAVLELVNLKECMFFNEQIVKLIPEAVFSLCAGCDAFMPYSGDTSIPSRDRENDNKLFLFEDGEQELVDRLLECSVEAIAEIKQDSATKVRATCYISVRLARQIRQPLIHEFEEHLTSFISSNKNFDGKAFSILIYTCSFLCNSIYGSISTRLTEGSSTFFTKVFDYIAEVLDHITNLTKDKCNEIRCRGCINISSIIDSPGSILASVGSLLSSPLFKVWKDNNGVGYELLKGVVQAVEGLLEAFGKLFDALSYCTNNLDPAFDVHQLPISNSSQEYDSLVGGKARIVDMELDVDEGSNDLDASTATCSKTTVTSFAPLLLKLELVSTISRFSSLLPSRAWEILFDLRGKDSDAKVCRRVLLNLCKICPGSAGSLTALVNLISTFTAKGRISIFNYYNILACIHALLGKLQSVCSSVINDDMKQYMEDSELEDNLKILRRVLSRVSEIGLFDWFARIELMECICGFVSLDPFSAQAIIERLLPMLQDPDYRVRLSLSRKVGLLFQTWDGHKELFDDICSNFGLEMVRSSKEKIVKAGEVLASGSQSAIGVETALITLAHIALSSDETEIEAIFMMCAAAAIDPCQRELVYALFDNLSRRLRYVSRSKYLEQLMGPILARWVACEVSLLALVEVQDLFVVKSDAKCFMQHCCTWLLPPLILKEDATNLDLVSKVACHPLSTLVRQYFVSIFAICMAVHCSMRPDKETGRVALTKSLLLAANMSEIERDGLIKKHMVSIVSCLLSLTYASSNPELPFVTKETVFLSVQTVVDGFLEMDRLPTDVGIVDKINIFRPDRVFKFLLEMHFQVAASVHPRHICHRLSAIEVLINIIGSRAAVSSSSYYIISIVGQFIQIRQLQDQCCVILSKLLEAFKANPAKDVLNVLGKQLQFLVSKLVACCIPFEAPEEKTNFLSPGVIAFLHELIVEADPSLYDFIRDLEPFPELDCFERIRIFHDNLCKAYLPRDQFLMFVDKAYYLPEKLLLWRIRSLHKRLLSGEIIRKESINTSESSLRNCWDSDPDIVSAIWMLVGLCGSEEANTISGLLADFVSRVGIRDPCEIVFRLPKYSTKCSPFLSSSYICHKEENVHISSEVSDDLLVNILKHLLKCLSDDSVKTVAVASQTLRGILSTEKGHGVLLSLESYERSLIGIHSKGVNFELVENSLLDVHKNAEAISLDDSSLWSTESKTYATWVCSLVHSLISHSNDVILRLCQSVVSLKAEMADILLSTVLVNLSRAADTNFMICELISAKVTENIFLESNDLLKSIQILLDSLNKLRSCYVTEKMNSFSVQHGRPSSSGKVRSTSEKSKERLSNAFLSCSFWKKVYWLSIDYLVVAKAAIRCGSYFTAIMYVEHWCEEHFDCLQLGSPDFSDFESLPPHIDLLVAAFTQINEPDSLYGIIQSNKLTSQIITFEHEGNWSKALEYYDLLVRSFLIGKIDSQSGKLSGDSLFKSSEVKEEKGNWKLYKGLMRSLQRTGCTHLLDVYCQGLTSQKGNLQHDSEFTDIQYEAAWRAGNWDFTLGSSVSNVPNTIQYARSGRFNENLHSCLRALWEGNASEFHVKLTATKKDLVLSTSCASRESTEFIHSTIIKLQILDHLGMAWDIRWKPYQHQESTYNLKLNEISPEPVLPARSELEWHNAEWNHIQRQAALHLDLYEPFIAFRRVLLQTLDCKEYTLKHLLESASTLRKGSRFSLAASALHELKQLCCQQQITSETYFLGRLEEAKLLRAQGQHEMAINLGRYIVENSPMGDKKPNVYRLVGKWLAETRSSNSSVILEKYLKHSVELAQLTQPLNKEFLSRQCQAYYHLAHYADGLFKSYEERLASSEWQAAMRLRRHKARELDALMKRVRSSSKGDKIDYTVKIQELQKQLKMDNEEAGKLQVDRDNFLSLALEGYQQSLVIGGKYDLRVVFRLVSLWFSFYSRQDVIKAMMSAVKEVQSYKFIPLVYQIASRLGSSKDAQGSTNFQIALVSLVRKMAIDHPYHTIFQLLALANGDRVKDKQRSRNSFIVDLDKKLAAENLLNELSSYHGALIQQMKQLVDVYIKLAELETRKEETNKRVSLPREIRSLRQLELVPVVTASVPVDPSCQYKEGSFPYFKGLADSIMIMNGINAPKVVECYGSDGLKYRQLAKSGNDDLRQDAVMEQFFGLVNNFLQNHRDTRKRRLRIRTYRVVPFTPSAGVLEWVDRTIPLGEYLLGSTRNGGAHGRYRTGDWSFLQCREYMANEKDKRRAFLKVCENFRPVMHYFFLERFLQPADWFKSRLSYTRSVAASSMVGYIVGLGDRHSMNILIDQETAEVVHIDLGVAFEQGLMLKTPERVPFRLTRDIIDGMGVTGVEGVFRRCCEETLSVMRTNKEALLTIIEVFIHDPLYKWALSPLKALQRQKETDDDIDPFLESSQDAYEGNMDAARATLRVKQKLDGYEMGEMRSVQGQVQQLIQDAVDIDRLCHMFPGWGAWL